MNIELILEQFQLQSCAVPFGNGHINTTYLLPEVGCILQKINTSIFQDPEALMENIMAVTDFQRKKNPSCTTLQIVKTKDGKSFYQDPSGDCYRVYNYIEETRSVESNATETDLYEAGACLGRFQKALADFPVETLHEVIKDFHHTPKRVQAFKEAISNDLAGRVSSVQAEIDFALRFSEEANLVVDGLKAGTILSRVTHNDTKINNYLFEANGSKALCLIDLDTVMPGSLLYDVGDALRLGGSTAAEDEADLSKVHFNEYAFKAFVQGYLSEMHNELTPTEFELLPFSVRLITYEQGVRFLTDYLNGDTYYKTNYAHHNLVRARNQFKLVSELVEKESIMKGMISE